MLKRSKIFYKQIDVFRKSHYLVRSKHSNEGFQSHVEKVSGFHQSNNQEYPTTKQLPLPSNIEDLASSETLQFSPKRNRDICASFISLSLICNEKIDKNALCDARVECYDCSGAISLSSTMQTNVPFPFTSKGKPTHLNMPGGQWGQSEKYTSEDLNKYHETNSKQTETRNGGTFVLSVKKRNKHFSSSLLSKDFLFSCISSTFSNNTVPAKSFCTEKKQAEELERKSDEKEVKNQGSQLTRREKLKAAVKDYGSVVLIFHVTISLVSLGCCYLLVASGIDLTNIMKLWGVDEGAATAGTAAQFVIAYAVHKATAPGRIAITLTAVPFIVKKLRKSGYLKPPKSKPQ